jgi:hypothetical protein
MTAPVSIVLSKSERLLLILAAVAGLFGLNGVFVYYAVFRRPELNAVLFHPVGGTLMLEAFLIVALAAVFLARRPIGRWGWKSFVLFSLLGGLAFSIPVILLLNDRGDS